MNFDDMKKIWDTQNNEHVYAINEEGLHRRISAKKRQAAGIANITEHLLIFANLAAVAVITASMLVRGEGDVYRFLMMALMLATAGFVMVSRHRRKKWLTRFDLTLLGELNHAIANATWQVRLSYSMRWYVLPVAAITVLALAKDAPTLWTWLLIAGFFIIALFAGNKEHRYYQARKQRLQRLRDKLMSDS